jgi:methyl-accepting chemotaxis protein
MNQETLKQMLDVVCTNVMYADADFNLVYMNDLAKSTLEEIADAVKSEFNLEIEELIGINIDKFHGAKAKNIRKILSSSKNFPHHAEISFGGKILDLNINCVEVSGKIVGYVVNWSEVSLKKKLEVEAARARSMVDQSPVNTMMADKSGKIVYMNQKSKETLLTIQKDLPIKVDQMVGVNIDMFHKNPEHQRNIIKDQTKLPMTSKIKVGENFMDLKISPIFDHNGTYIGPMVTWELITEKLKLVNELTETATQLNDSAKKLQSVSTNMAASAEETSAQSNTAAAASEEVNSGVQTVATNMEEMAASIKEITKSTNESSQMSNEAMKMATNTNNIISQLGASSQDIGDVIKVISSIAQQTNLLALNATIEAARAGEAGKGFAVVANEVKELAKQTAKATNDITKKIETIQNDSKTAVGAIAEISMVVEKLNNNASNIAASVEEQAAATNEVSRIVQESAEAVRSISSNIAQVSEAASVTGKGANQTQDAAKNLGNIAEQLTKLVKSIKV